MVVPPKHPKMIIFSRKTPKFLGTSILGNPHIVAEKFQIFSSSFSWEASIQSRTDFSILAARALHGLASSHKKSRGQRNTHDVTRFLSNCLHCSMSCCSGRLKSQDSENCEANLAMDEHWRRASAFHLPASRVEVATVTCQAVLALHTNR